MTEKQTEKQYLYFIAEEYEKAGGLPQFGSAQITIISRDTPEIPYFSCSSLCRISYQCNKTDEDNLKAGRYYAEHITDMKPEDIKPAAAVFARMEKYADKIYRQGLTLNVYPPGNEYAQRIALLKAIGATRLYIDRASRTCEYSLAPSAA